MRILETVFLAGALAMTSAAAIAAGGGGGGGGEMPSASTPSYDPAEEYRKAVAAIQAKEFKKAATAAQHVTEAAPRSVEGWRVLGIAQAGSFNWKGARKAYEKAVKLAPDDVISHAGLGMALAKLQDGKAQAELDWLKAKASACGSCSDAAQLQAATTEVEGALAGSTPKPAALLENRSLLFAQGDAAYVQAVSLINEKRYDDALKSLDAAREVFGPHPDVLTYQGYTWRKKGDFAKAQTFYEQALSIAPDHRGATEYYGELKVERGDMAGARQMLARLDKVCAFGCAEAEELRRWISAGGEPGR
jgi:tetratricopeptide (TPR) repeat protein